MGKDELAFQFCLNHYVETYVPAIEDCYRKQVTIDGESCMLEILDTTGQEEYTALRNQWIREGEGFLLVYSITSRSSFRRIRKFYDHLIKVKESLHLSKPQSYWAIMLVGSHSERVTERVVSAQEGHQLARELGCDFVEASTKNCINVGRAFYDLVRQIRRQHGSKLQERPKLGPPQVNGTIYFNCTPAQRLLWISQLWDRIRTRKDWCRI